MGKLDSFLIESELFPSQINHHNSCDCLLTHRTSYFMEREVGVVFGRFKGDGIPNKVDNIPVDSSTSEDVHLSFQKLNKDYFTFMFISTSKRGFM